VRAVIAFTDPDHAWVDFEYGYGDSAAQVVELCCGYVLRSAANLSARAPETIELGALLVQYADAGAVPRPEALGSELRLTPDARNGRRRFDVTLGAAGVKVKTSGFGMMGKGIGYYSPTSVLCLIAAAGAEISGDGEMSNLLLGVCATAGSAVHEGRVTVTNQLRSLSNASITPA